MIDLSDSGCRIATREKLHLGQTVIVRFRGHKEIAGTVAGDDTLFLAVRGGYDADAVAARFRALSGQS